ncbi:MAG: biotin--[acetyl-CoA-carboxylase] ligase [Chryseolinea sp.]
MYKIPASTVFMGKNLVFMPECHSTNTFALELCHHSIIPEEGTVVATANQTAGRGQRGSTWIVEPGANLTFSIILYPAFLTIADQFYLNMAICLGINDYLIGKECEKVCIKWPNDIYVGDRKICGILIENQISGKSINSSIVGIGLNINQIIFSMNTATSLSLETGTTYELSNELEHLLVGIESRFLMLRDAHFNLLKKDYLNSLYRINEEHTFEFESEKFRGTITGVDSHGRLLIQVAHEQRTFEMKEVKFIMP